MFAIGSLELKFSAHLNWATLFAQVALLYYLHLMRSGLVEKWALVADHRRLAHALAAETTATPVHARVQSPAAMPLLHAAAHDLLSTRHHFTSSLPPLPPLPTVPWGSSLDPSDPFGATASKQLLTDLIEAQEGVAAFLSSSPAARVALVAALEARAREQLRRARLDAACLLLNVIAFLGFCTCILAFFVSDTALASTLPFYPDSATAVRYGCLLGIVAWTCEPLLLLLVPPAIERAKQSERAALVSPVDDEPTATVPLPASSSNKRATRRAAASPRPKRKAE